MIGRICKKRSFVSRLYTFFRSGSKIVPLSMYHRSRYFLRRMMCTLGAFSRYKNHTPGGSAHSFLAS